MILERIKERRVIRANLIASLKDRVHTLGEDNWILISESIDDYIEHRIQSDKVLEGILKDIQGNIAESVDRQLKVENLIKDLVEEKNLFNFDTQNCHSCANFDWMTEECTLPKADDGIVKECRWTPKKKKNFCVTL